MQIFGYVSCLVSEIARPSVAALVISLAAAVVSVDNSSQNSSHTVDLGDLVCVGSLTLVCW